jgi:aspartyl-tRNA(Asn)/glutamyl-tRNA(Gln) amidotransferase subunit A
MAGVISDLASLTLAEAAELIKTRKISPVELTQGYLERIRRYDPAVNAYILVTEEIALAQARAAEQKIMAGHYRGPMHGIPYALKDIVETAGVATTAHSRLLKDYVPETDAFVVARLKEAGAVMLGKLACLEFAHASPTPDQAWPQARNPWNTDYGFTGGSSTGSASAIAASLALCAIGTDTGGSVRNPASLCGVSGVMATYGRVSRRGVIPYSFSMDHVGPLAWTAQDCALMLQAIAGYDDEDPGSADTSVPNFSAKLRDDLKGVKIGWVRHFYEQDQVADDDTRAAMDSVARTLQDLGATIEETSMRHLADYHDAKLIISAAEFYAVHEVDFQNHFHDYGADLQAKTFQGAFISAADYIQAMRQRRLLAREMQKMIAPYDVILTASNFGPAPKIIKDTPDPKAFFTRLNITSIFNLTANPAISICSGFSAGGLPLAGQLIGKQFDEATLLAVAHAYERATPWHKRRPVLREA